MNNEMGEVSPALSEETKKELKSKYNPEGSKMREIQLRLLDMLLYLKDVCEKLNIQYYLDGGTLLGAVRHCGFIPWDDDVDIVINVKDLKKLRHFLINNPHPPFVYVDRKTDKGYYFGWPKLVDNSSTSYYHGDLLEMKNQNQQVIHNGISLDIFPYSDHVIVWMNKVIHRLHNLNNRYILAHSTIWARFISFLLFSICKPVAVFIGLLFSCRKHIAHDYLSHNTVHRFVKDKVYPLSTVMFEGYVFKAPGDTHYYLSTLYNDYMCLPPEEARHHHNLTFTLIPYESNN